MSSATLDARYLDWLCSQVGSVKRRDRSRTHRMLLEQLYDTEFVAFVPHDENRIEDAKDLRYEYLAEFEEEQGDPRWIRKPCSMFELLIVLSRQLSFEMDDDEVVWFWHLIEVMELEKYTDAEYNEDVMEEVSRVLQRVIWRKYSPDGHGGLFPLRDSHRDQRQVELWYQLNAYLIEQF